MLVCLWSTTQTPNYDKNGWTQFLKCGEEFRHLGGVQKKGAPSNGINLVVLASDLNASLERISRRPKRRPQDTHRTCWRDYKSLLAY
ncbi:hypothetical protein ILYODFUR_028778 [Ilyodon furcidens]|uniref:Uncharacterized protein n=1 Tax=Ilyodon furcidens TaxID=33524 RepID=A0ABV0UZ96_9TELE